MVICLERGADLHMAQLMPLPLTVSCFSKIKVGFTFPVPAHPGSPGQRAVKRVCVCLFFWQQNLWQIFKLLSLCARHLLIYVMFNMIYVMRDGYSVMLTYWVVL